LLKAKKLERRVKKRINLPGKVLARVLKDREQPPEKPFRGELLDISESGLAFIVKTTQKSARMLLGHNLDMKLTFAELESEMEIDTVGTVVAVNREPFNEYIVHADFSKNLTRIVIDDLEDLAKPLGKPGRQ
jgi:c-di-GMP-binding flagellar brake protein YcgR